MRGLATEVSRRGRGAARRRRRRATRRPHRPGASRPARHRGPVEQGVADPGRGVGEVLHDPPRPVGQSDDVDGVRRQPSRGRRRPDRADAVAGDELSASPGTTPSATSGAARTGRRGSPPAPRRVRRRRRRGGRTSPRRARTAPGRAPRPVERAPSRRTTGSSCTRSRRLERRAPRSPGRPRPPATRRGASARPRAIVASERRARAGRRHLPGCVAGHSDRHPGRQVALVDPPVELGEGDLQRLHRLVEGGAVEVVGGRAAEHRLDGVDLVEQRPGSGSPPRARRISRSSARTREGSDRARAGSARRRALDRSAHGAAGTSAGPDSERSTPIHSRSS